MHGLMMDQPLLISDLIRFADRHHGDTGIVSKTVEGAAPDGSGAVHRYTYPHPPPHPHHPASFPRADPLHPEPRREHDAALRPELRAAGREARAAARHGEALRADERPRAQARHECDSEPALLRGPA